MAGKSALTVDEALKQIRSCGMDFGGSPPAGIDLTFPFKNAIKLNP
jgi:hypothetical protein